MPLNHYREKIRQEAEAFINEEVGEENLVSVCEHVTFNGPFSVVVWYRARRSSASAKPDAPNNARSQSKSPLAAAIPVTTEANQLFDS
jgi:hypothetical protein